MALAEAARGEFLGRELAVLAVNDRGQPPAAGGEGGVNERTEIVAVDDIRSQPPDGAGQAERGAGREAARFSEHLHALRMRQPVGESAAPLEAGDVHLKVATFQHLRHVYDAVFHAAGVERIDDMEDFHGLRGRRKWASARRRKSGGSRTRAGRRNSGHKATEVSQ